MILTFLLSGFFVESVKALSNFLLSNGLHGSLDFFFVHQYVFKFDGALLTLGVRNFLCWFSRCCGCFLDLLDLGFFAHLLFCNNLVEPLSLLLSFCLLKFLEASSFFIDFFQIWRALIFEFIHLFDLDLAILGRQLDFISVKVVGRRWAFSPEFGVVCNSLGSFFFAVFTLLFILLNY